MGEVSSLPEKGEPSKPPNPGPALLAALAGAVAARPLPNPPNAPLIILPNERASPMLPRISSAACEIAAAACASTCEKRRSCELRMYSVRSALKAMNALVSMPTLLHAHATAATCTTSTPRPGRVNAKKKYCCSTRCTEPSGSSMLSMRAPKTPRKAQRTASCGRSMIAEVMTENGAAKTSHTPQAKLISCDTLAAAATKL
mmetsp:Transcript_67407/g.133594  ORF Transcript_67407/g.133594 Transcript_67407/m.133594 type:complete len:201 (+) Transcript_67407:551-1153(+)